MLNKFISNYNICIRNLHNYTTKQEKSQKMEMNFENLILTASTDNDTFVWLA